MSATFDEQEEGLFVVHYAEVSDLLPVNQAELVERLTASAGATPTAVGFVLADGIAWVDPAVPKYWLEVTARVRLAGMAIVTGSAGVRVAASGFRLANVVRGVKLPVATFEGEATAISWLKDQLRVAAA